ncbi:MAG TPA: glutaredoxin family protein [archaeon]|nr:glutaredoxin family protein [archaeon]
MKNVVVYSTAMCPYCVMEKDWLKKNGIDFKNVMVDEDRKAAQEMILKSGQTGVPVTDIDGAIVVGFNKEELKRLLGIK